MRKIKTFKQLDKIQDEAYHEACVGDLFWIRTAYVLFDGYLVIVTNETIMDAKKGTYYITKKDFNKWSKGNQNYFKWYYLGYRPDHCPESQQDHKKSNPKD